MRTDKLLAISALALLACEVPPVPHALLPDSAYVDAYRPDMGVIVVHDSAVIDVGTDSAVDSAVDAPTFDTGPSDTGVVSAIRLDGVFDEPFWTTVGNQPNTTPAIAPYDGDALTALHFGRDADYLYLGFEGTLLTGDAVVVYVDTHFGDGVPLVGALGDTHGAVNGVLSLPIMSSSGEFQPEWGWGTSTMPRTAVSSDLTIGWRRLAASPGPFVIQGPNELTACSTTGCETQILLVQLGVPPGGYLQLVVRLGHPGVGFSNQTFPVFDASTPEIVSDTTITVPAAT
jgi:hypothetical protein